MKKKLITSALPYVNNIPHLGNIIGSVLSADVYARYCKEIGYETLYICATDEYGTATENKARQESLTPQEICDKYHIIHKEIYDYFNIQFDFFGRTSTSDHTEITQEIFNSANQNGFIFEKTSEQTFCNVCFMFLADRYVIGDCPHCGFEQATGDQCDSCGKLLQPTELKFPKCTNCGIEPVRKETTHMYINLEKLQDDLSEFKENSFNLGKWAVNAVSTTDAWLKKGLESRPITRDLQWGVPVPIDSYEKKVFYVWFDAPIGYVSQTKRFLPNSWKDWWFDPENTELYQFMAKDNIPFHTVIFPACQLATRQNWTMLHHISSTEYLNYEDAKFSKSRKIGVFGDDVKKTQIDIDLWRLYLILNRPEKADTRFTWELFFEEINSTFINNVGNLLNRLMIFVEKHFGKNLSGVNISLIASDFLILCKDQNAKIFKAYESVSLREAAHLILLLGNMGNKFFQESQPWKLIKDDENECKAVLAAITFVIRDIGLFLHPIMPRTSQRILKILGFHEKTLHDIGSINFFAEHEYGERELLFAKLDTKLIEKFKAQFSEKTASTGGVPLEDTLKRSAIIVGQIKEIKQHPNADKLYIEQIDCGEGNLRQVVSGLREHFSIDELQDKKVLVATGLLPAKIRGELSDGMLLTCQSESLLELPIVDNVQLGTSLIFESEVENQSIDNQSYLKKLTIDEFLNLGLALHDGVITLDGKNLSVAGVSVKAPSLLEAKVI